MKSGKAYPSKRLLIRITVDHREKCSRLLRTLYEADNVSLKKGCLTVGDYQLNNLIVERKTLPDLVNSIKEGRLFSQAFRLKNNDFPSVIIIEGTMRDLHRSGMKREALQGALITLMIRFAIPVLRSISPEESARLMLYAVRQLERNSRFSFKRNKLKGARKKNQNLPAAQLFVLQGIPGIGPQRAKMLLKHFGSISAIFQATMEELSGVPGFGDANAKQIYHTIHDDVSEFL